MTDPLAHLEEHHVCGCGSCKKAVEDALAEVQKLYTQPGGCIHWYMTRATIHVIIANLIAQDPEVDPAVVERIVERQRKLQDHFLDDRTLSYIRERMVSFDEMNALAETGGKVN